MLGVSERQDLPGMTGKRIPSLLGLKVGVTGGRPGVPMVQDIPNQLISWRSLPDSTVQHSGSVRFEPATGGRGTIVRVEMEYAPPGGAIGVAMAKLHRREPGQEVHDSLRHFRQLMETGVIPTIKGQSSGRKEGTSKKFDYPMPKGEPRPEPRAEGVLS